jgi:hypothetical protein
VGDDGVSAVTGVFAASLAGPSTPQSSVADTSASDNSDVSITGDRKGPRSSFSMPVLVVRESRFDLGALFLSAVGSLPSMSPGGKEAPHEVQKRALSYDRGRPQFGQFGFS